LAESKAYIHDGQDRLAPPIERTLTKSQSVDAYRQRELRETAISSFPPISRGNQALEALSLAARHLVLQLVRFGLVGICATATLAVAYYYIISTSMFTPFFANLAAYGIAFSVSFVGHRSWTFGDAEKGGRNAHAVWRFLAVSLSGLAVNSAAVLILVNALALPDWTPLIVFVGFTPVVTFLLNRFWVFYALK
jgi:putative flippase GtrA